MPPENAQYRIPHASAENMLRISEQRYMRPLSMESIRCIPPISLVPLLVRAGRDKPAPRLMR